jgi:hypothetical protein
MLIMDLFKTDKITPKGCHVFSGESCHPFGIEYCVTSVLIGIRNIYFLTAAKPTPFGPRCVPMTAVTFANRISRGTDRGTRDIISLSNF